MFPVSLPNWFASRWRWLVATPPSLYSQDRRQLAELLAAMIIVLGLLALPITALLTTVVDSTTPFWNDGNFWIMAVAVLTLTIPFQLNRRGHFKTAAWLFVITAAVAVYLPCLPDGGAVEDLDYLEYLVVPILLATVLLGNTATIVLAVVESIGILALLVLYPQWVEFSQIVGYFTFVLLVSCLIIVVGQFSRFMALQRLRLLGESEERYRIMFESNVHATMVHDGDMVLMVNSSAAQICGYANPEELVGKRFKDFIHPEDYAMVSERAHQRLSGGSPPGRYEMRILGADGVTRWVDSKSSVITLNGQKVTLAQAVDVTEHKRHEAQLRQQNEYLSALHNTALELMNRLNIDEVLEAILRRAAELVGTKDGYIYLLTPDEVQMYDLIRIGIFTEYDKQAIRPGEGLTGKVWETAQPLVVNNYSTWSQRLSNPKNDIVRASVGVPLMSNDKVFGVIALVYCDDQHTFGQAEVDVLSRFADLAAIAYDNARLYTATEQRNQVLETLNRFSRTVSTIFEVDPLLNTIAQITGEALNATSTYVCEWDADASSVKVVADYFGTAANDLERVSDLGQVYRFSSGYGESGDWLATPNQHRIFHVDDPDCRPQEREHLLHFGGKTILRVPMLSEGKPIGMIEIWDSRQRREFTSDELSLLHSIVNQAGIAFEKARLYSALQKSEERNRVILNAIPDLIFNISGDGVYLGVTTSSRNELYLPPEQLLGKKLVDVLPLNVAEKLMVFIGVALTSDEMQVCEYQLEVPLGVQDYEARIVKTGQGEVLVFVRNITERKQAHARELELKLEKERLRMLEDFISDASHDLKTPLANLRSRLYLVRKMEDEKNRERQIGIAEAEVKRLERLIEDLLTMAHLDSKTAQLTFEAVDLNLMLREIFKSYYLMTLQKDLRMSFDFDSALPAIWGDSAEINRVITNLLSNAVNYTPEGAIRIKTYAHQSGAVVEITDTGIGIAPDDLPHIFDRFYRADKARSTDKGGTGLGLAIVKKIIDLHDGWVEVESEPGSGSTFRIWLPAMNMKIGENTHGNRSQLQ